MNMKIINKIFICFSLCFFLGGINSFAQTSYTIVPGVKFGDITARTSEADLKRIYGEKNVESGEVGLGEGETLPGTILFPNDPNKTVAIAWKNEKTRKSPDFIQFAGDKSFWKISNGVTLGTSLKTLEQLNGKGFVLYGFQWDYSGELNSWNRGKLARTFGNKNEIVLLRLNPDYDKASEKDLKAVVGDGNFSSKHKVMQKLNPKVDFIIVRFP